MSGRVLAVAVFGLTTAMYVTGIVLTVLADQPLGLNELLIPVVYAFAVVGFLIARRRPRNAIAWICLGIGCAWGLESALFGAVFYGVANPDSALRPDVLAALAAPLWIPGVFVMTTFLLMLFPDGHLMSRRWTWLPWLAGTGISLWYVVTVFTEPETYGYGRPSLDNPFASWPDGRTPLLDFLEGAISASVFVAITSAVSALVLRFRRSTGIERHQLKWLATAGAAGVVLFVISVFLVDSFGETVGLIAAMSFIVIPVSIGIAVLRYRLYEIDRLISRTVSYAVVVGLLAAVYAGIAIGLPQVLTDSLDSILVAGATLAVAALFNPVRRRVQRVVDRRFNRVRYDAQMHMDRLASRLRTELDLDDLTGEVLGVVTTTMQPATTSVWIREER